MDGIELMQVETAVDLSMSNTIALCKKHSIPSPSASQVKIMDDLARTFFHEILKAGQQNTTPLPGKDDFAFFFFKNQKRASLKSIHFIIVEKHLEPLIQNFYANMQYECRPRPSESEIGVFFNPLEREYSYEFIPPDFVWDKEQKKIEDLDFENRNPETLKKELELITKKRREHKRQDRVIALGNYYYRARRDNLAIAWPSGLRLQYFKKDSEGSNIGGDVGRNLHGNFLYYDKREEIKKCFDSENLDRRMQAGHLLRFYDLLLKRTFRVDKENSFFLRCLTGLALGANAKHLHYQVEFSNEYLAKWHCGDKDLSQIVDLRLSTMNFDMTHMFEAFLSRSQQSLIDMEDRLCGYKVGGCKKFDVGVISRLTDIARSNTSPSISGNDLMAIPVQDIAKEGVAWAASIRQGVQIMRDGVGPFLEFIEKKGPCL